MGSNVQRKRNENRFSHDVAVAIRDRFLRRVQRREEHTGNGRAATWAYAVIRNKSKVTARLRNAIQEKARNTPWEDLISGQKEKLWRLIDPYRRWMKREAYILDEMNRGDFRQEPIYVLGFAWGYAADLQRQKLQVTLLPAPPHDGRRWPGWHGVQNRVGNRVSRLVTKSVQPRDSWKCVIGGIQRRLHGTLELESDWNPCLLRARRRWKR